MQPSKLEGSMCTIPLISADLADQLQWNRKAMLKVITYYLLRTHSAPERLAQRFGNSMHIGLTSLSSFSLGNKQATAQF